RPLPPSIPVCVDSGVSRMRWPPGTREGPYRIARRCADRRKRRDGPRLIGYDTRRSEKRTIKTSTDSGGQGGDSEHETESAHTARDGGQGAGGGPGGGRAGGGLHGAGQ